MSFFKSNLRIKQSVISFFKTVKDKLLNLETETKVIILSIIAYTAVMSFFTIMRMYALESSAWDLGNYNQAMFTFTYNGKLFSLTTEMLNNPSGSLFGIHFSPIFFLQVPFYFVYPHPETLLVLQSFILALGVIPTYLISRDYFPSSKWRLTICFAYLLNPALLGINAFDFHPEAYIGTFYLFILYFYTKRKWIGVWSFSLLLFSTIEFSPIALLFLAFYFVSKDLVFPMLTRKEIRIDMSLLANLGGLIIVSVVWLVMALHIITSFSPNIPLMQGQTQLWPTLGASNLMQVPIKVVEEPWKALNALSSDGIMKVLYLIVICVPWLLLPLFSTDFWFLSSYWLFPALLSNNVPFYTVGLQYSAFIIGPLTYSGIRMLNKFVKNAKWDQRRLISLFILFGLLLSNPFLSLNAATNAWAGYGLPALSGKAIAVNHLLALIPTNASVLSDSNIFPMLSSRPNAYTIPWQIDFKNISFFNYVNELVGKVDYIITDTDYWPPLTALILSQTNDFGVIGYLNGVLVLKRNYQASPIVFAPSSYTFDYTNLSLTSGSIISDNSSQSYNVLFRSADLSNGSDFWWGPYEYLSTPGKYNITFWLKTNEAYDGPIMTLDHTVFPAIVAGEISGDNITGYYQTIGLSPNSAEKQVYSGITLTGDMLKVGEYTPVRMEIDVNIPGIYEFRGMNVSASIPLYLDRIELTLTKPYPSTEPVLVRFNDYSPVSFDQQHQIAAVKIGQFVVSNSTLLLQQELFPFVVHARSSPILIPTTQSGRSYAYLNNIIDSSDFIMLDWKSNIATASLIMSLMSNATSFGTYAFSDGIALLKRDYSGNPVFFNPLVYKFTSKDMLLQNGTSTVTDEGSLNQNVLFHNSANSDFWWGPFSYLYPGEYQVTYRLKVTNDGESQIMMLQINCFKSDIVQATSNSGVSYIVSSTDTKIEVSNKTLSSNDFKSIGIYYNITMDFVADALGQYEFPGRAVQTNAGILLDEIDVQLLKPYDQLNAK